MDDDELIKKMWNFIRSHTDVHYWGFIEKQYYELQDEVSKRFELNNRNYID